MTTKAIVFDLWNTLAYNKGVKSNPILKLEQLLGLKLNLYREIEEGFMARRFRTKKEAMTSLCRHIGMKPKPVLVDTLVYVWENSTMDMTLFPDVIPHLERLKGSYRIGLLSNTDCFTIKNLKENGFTGMFDSVAFSCELGLLKPDPKIFRLMLHELKVNPNEAVMVGDNLKDDVLAAENVGMRGILMKRDFSKYKTKPSHTETATHERMITDIEELEKFL